MEPLPAGRDASAGGGVPPYARHRPERTLLYQLVRDYYPAFKAHLAAQGAALPGNVEQEFEDFLKCGRLEHGLIPGILPCAPSGPAFGCSNAFLTYLSARALRQLPRRAPGGVQLQTPGLLSELRRPTHGGERRAAGRRGVSRTAGEPVGVERAVSVALPVCQPPRDHGRCARYCLPLHRHAPDQEGGVLPSHGPGRRGHCDPTTTPR